MRTLAIMIVAVYGVIAPRSPERLPPRQAERRAQPPSRRNPLIDAIVSDVNRIDAEFAADILISVSQSPRVDDGFRMAILNEAFMRAYGAQEPFRRISVGIPPESRQGAQTSAYATQLTALSLQARAVQQMAFVDTAASRSFFEWLDPNTAATPCEESLVPSIAEYFTTLGLLARTSFRAAQRPEAVAFLVNHLWRARLPADMAAVALALERFHATRDEAAYLETVFRTLLDNGDADARGFSGAGLDLVSSILHLDEMDQALELNGSYLVRALRPYLVKQLTGPRCADSGSEPIVAATFNARVRKMQTGDIAELSASESRPSRANGTAKVDMYWQTPESQRLYDAFWVLRGKAKDPVAMSVRRTKEWQDRADHLVIDLEQWGGLREPQERDAFYEKSVLLTWLIDLTPASTVHTHALRSFVDELRHSRMAREQRMLWFLFVNRLLEMARGADRGSILTMLEASGHPVLSLYARVERIMPGVRNRTN